MSENLQENYDECHQRFHQTELQCGLFAEAQESNRVGFARQTTRSVHTGRFNGFASNLGHDVALSAQIFVAKGQEIVYYKCYNRGKWF